MSLDSALFLNPPEIDKYKFNTSNIFSNAKIVVVYLSGG